MQIRECHHEENFAEQKKELLVLVGTTEGKLEQHGFPALSGYYLNEHVLTATATSFVFPSTTASDFRGAPAVRGNDRKICEKQAEQRKKTKSRRIAFKIGGSNCKQQLIG